VPRFGYTMMCEQSRQIGAETQAGFCAWAEREPLPALRAI
jgi:hypothetical protein